MTTPADAIFMSVHIPASADLAAVNASVKLYEETIGPLASMKIDNAMTLLKFNATTASPAKFAKISAQVNGQPVVPDGAKVVAVGQIYVAGSPTLCAAVRGP